MAGLSGRNTKIAPSKLGCRLPFEFVAVGDGYAGAGPCLVRKMTPEEMARYGPPKPRAEDNPFRSRLIQAIKVSKSPEEAAELLGMTVGKLNQYLGANGIHPRWDKRKEDGTMSPAIQMTKQEAMEKLPPAVLEKCMAPDTNNENLDTVVHQNKETAQNKESGVDEKQGDSEKVVHGQPEFYQGSTSAHRFTPERIARAEGVLSREEYIQLKDNKVADQRIIKDFKLNSELLIALKKKWGVADLKLKSIPPRKTSAKPLADPKEEPPVQTPPAGLTIAQAVELREELAEDVDSLRRILDVAHRGAELTNRVVQMIETQWSIHKSALDRINEAFEKTVLPL